MSNVEFYNLIEVKRVLDNHAKMIEKLQQGDKQKSAAAGSKLDPNRLPKQIQRIDWSKVAKGVMCEFSNNDDYSVTIPFHGHGPVHGGYYGSGISNGELHCTDKFKRCRFALNTPTLWLGGSCPLPEGVMVRFHFRGELPIENSAVSHIWDRTNESDDIIYYEITGLAEGYEY